MLPKVVALPFFIVGLTTILCINCVPITINEDINFRLPNNTIPENYTINLRSWVNEGNFSFTGVVFIHLLALEDTDFVTVHQDGFTINDIVLWDGENPIPIGEFEYNSTLDFLTVPVHQNLIAGQRYTLEIDYNGTLRDDDLGFYRSSYVNEEGVTVWLAATQFQTASARRAFPCYDEPGLKATIKVYITHDPSYEALSNMPDVATVPNDDGSVTTEFENSPPMSTYLVAFVVSEFPHISGDLSRPVLQRVFARSTAINQSYLIFEASEPMLDNLIEYFGVDYPLPKLDQIAIPDFRYGAMENWGLVTYLELLFLYDENTSTYTERIGVVQAIAHEYSHQWFGNLVSPSWWTYMWLNEGFASFFQNTAINMIYPDWNMMDYFLVRTLQSVFQSDALITSPAMNMYIEHADLVTGQFSLMTSEKAAAVVQMFFHAFTEPTFLKGLQIYLTDRAFSIASEEDLFRAVEVAVREDNAAPAHIDVATVMFSWTSQGGFPVITVNRSYSAADSQTITVSQERYLSNPSDTSDFTWWIPINYATSQNPNFDDTSADDWVQQNDRESSFTVSSALAPTDWLMINKQATGYYRILYDETNYRLLSDAMVRNISVFHRLSRAQLVDDAYNFVLTDRLSYVTFFNVIRFLEFEDEYAPWYPVVRALNALDRFLSGHHSYPLFRDFIRRLVEHLYDTVRAQDITDEPILRKYSRTIAINWACNMGSVHCRSDAIRELRALMVSGGEFHQNVGDVLYCAALRSGNSNDFNYVWNRALNSDNANLRNRLIAALGCSTTSRQLQEFLRSSLNSTNENNIEYRPGEPIRVVNAVYQNSLLGLEIVLDFISANREEAYAVYGAAGYETIIIGLSQRVSLALTDRFNDLLNASYAENLIADHIPFYSDLYRETNRDWLAEHGDAISDWLEEHKW